MDPSPTIVLIDSSTNAAGFDPAAVLGTIILFVLIAVFGIVLFRRNRMPGE